ncbi:MAG: hypothetical protein JWQ97_2296 [Phenylobacterium sp.]|nr:hypothetical protein [Phenylobacterium sp.]
MQHLTPSAVRYIKLGPGGSWLERCLSDGLVELGYHGIPHELAAAGRWEQLEQQLVGEGRSPGKAKSFIREVRDFYTLGPDGLWITIGQGRLWWAFAEPEVSPLDEPGRGARVRKVIGRWQDESLTGERLDLSRLSTRLTKVAAYQQTICQVGEEGYLLRRLNGVEDAAVQRAHAANQELTAAALALIQALDWRDFELMVDLIFAASGWRRVSAVGGSNQADSDLMLEQAATGERAFVQVKSAANPAVLTDYLQRFAASGFDRMFFVCHSPQGVLKADLPNVHVWLRDRLAEQAIGAGLFNWLVEKVR